jgi:allantoate deiminase
MKININRILNHIDILSEYNSTPGEGCSRFSFTNEDKGARDYLIKNMKNLGMSVTVDSIGNIKGRLSGRNPQLPAVMCGSHIDTDRKSVV